MGKTYSTRELLCLVYSSNPRLATVQIFIDTVVSGPLDEVEREGVRSRRNFGGSRSGVGACTGAGAGAGGEAGVGGEEQCPAFDGVIVVVTFTLFFARALTRVVILSSA